MDNSLRVVILDQDQEARYQTQQMVQQLGYTVVAQTGLGTEAVSTVVDAKPDIVLCAFREPLARVVHTVESITHATKECPVIAYAPNSSLDLVRQAMLAGARDFLKAPLKPEELKRSLTSALEAGERWRLRESSGGNLLGPDGTIVTVFGAKGGVGKTTVAVNLAVALATVAGQKVLLVDADDTFGDGASSLSLRPEYTVTDILRQPAETAESFDKYLTYHESGLAVAASPESPFEWRAVPVDRFEAFLRRAARLFDVVLVDTSGTLSEINQAALEAASTVLWVTTPEYASVRDSIQAMNAMRRLRVQEERIRFVLNVTSLDSEASASSVAEALGHDLFWVIPYDAQARRAAQVGHAIIGDAKSPAGATIANLALVLSGLPARGKNGKVKQQKRRGTLLRLPFRRRQPPAEQEAPA